MDNKESLMDGTQQKDPFITVRVTVRKELDENEKACVDSMVEALASDLKFFFKKGEEVDNASN
jgi:hypothetical protein